MRIAINNYCNSKCPYCFAGNMGIDKNSNISLENFKKLLNMMLISKDKELILLGGEPTLHPNFEEILDLSNEYCRLFGWSFLLLSNTVKLQPFAYKLPKNGNILANINHETVLGKSQFDEMINSLEQLRYFGFFKDEENKYQNGSVTLGCNLCPEITNYDFFWDIVDRFNARSIRVSVTSPAKSEKYLKNRDEYYELMKPVFMDFINESFNRHLIISLDCNEIPTCYFTSTELYMVSLVTGGQLYNLGKCEPLFEVMPDLSVSCCFGDGDFKDKKKTIDDFKTTDEVFDYYNKRRAIATPNNYHMERCKTCFLKEINRCNAGCFGFKDGKCVECNNE